MGFSGNLTPDFGDNGVLPWASPPSTGFHFNKGSLATGTSLSGQIMLSVSGLLLGKENAWLPLNSRRGSASGSVFKVNPITVDLNLLSHFSLTGICFDPVT